MYLSRLIYASTISTNFESTDIEKILNIARKNNKKSHVTGMLYFNRKYFMQYLEGSRSEVNNAYKKILDDKRHSNVVILDYRLIDQREFSEWTMGYVPESPLTAKINLKHSINDTFDPYQMSGESAKFMMLSLRDSIPTI